MVGMDLSTFRKGPVYLPEGVLSNLGRDLHTFGRGLSTCREGPVNFWAGPIYLLGRIHLQKGSYLLLGGTHLLVWNAPSTLVYFWDGPIYLMGGSNPPLGILAGGTDLLLEWIYLLLGGAHL
eukprot:4052770-Pyramimonas_sp.AAC.1